MAHKVEPIVVPKFKTEAEEAQWWYVNRDKVEDALIGAMDNGTIRRGTAQRLTRETRASRNSHHPDGGSGPRPCPQAGGRKGITIPDLYQVRAARSAGEARATPG